MSPMSHLVCQMSPFSLWQHLQRHVSAAGFFPRDGELFPLQGHFNPLKVPALWVVRFNCTFATRTTGKNSCHVGLCGSLNHDGAY